MPTDTSRAIFRLRGPGETTGGAGGAGGTGSGGTSGNTGYGGMFFQPNARTTPAYDFSYLYGGLDALGQDRYKKSQISPYQFDPKRTQAQSVGAPERIGDDFYNNVQRTGVNNALPSILSQSQERLRQLNQGFGGGGLSGGASKELQLKNTFQTGSDIADVNRSLGSTIAQSKLSDEQSRNASAFSELQRVRDLNLQTNLQQQQSQADENFRAAGFNDSSARAQSSDLLARITALIQGGAQIPQLQGALQNQSTQAYFNVLQNLQGLTGLGGGQ